MKNKITITLLFFVNMVSFLFTNCKDSHDKIIYPTGIGEIKIGDDYNKVEKYCEKMNFYTVTKGEEVNEYERGLFIYKDTSLIIKIGNKNWGMPPYKVKMIDIYTSDFKTVDNISIGMKLQDFLKIFPDSKIELNEENLTYNIYPKKYQTNSKTNKFDIVFAINLKFISNEIGKKTLEDINKNKYKLDGVIESISIYDWN